MSSHADISFNHSCLKVPVNPSNKLPKPTYERKDDSFHKNGRDKTKKKLIFETDTNIHDGKNKSQKNGSGNILLEGKKASTDPSTDTLQSFINFYESIPDYRDINQLSDKEFYIQIEYFRQKQKSYLNMLKCDELHVDDRNSPAISTKYDDKVNERAVFSTHVSKNSNSKKNSYEYPKTPSDEIEKLHLEKSRHINRSLSRYSDNSTDSQPDVKRIPGNSTCPEIQIERCGNSDLNILNPGNKLSSTKDSVENYKMKKRNGNNHITNKTRDVHSGSTLKQGTPTGDSSSSIIDSMWDDFNADDYVPKKNSISSDSESEDNDTCHYSRSLPASPILKPTKNVAWKEPNITVPKPFKMTQREDDDYYRNSLRSLLVENVITEKEREKDSKVFKANPVPYTSQLPLYDTIMARQELRRLRERELFLARLRAQMRPFSFCDREKKMNCDRIYRSTPELRDPDHVSPKPFKARPVPKGLFSPHTYEKMFEDEYYRELKKRIRSEEMLRSSSLPPSMAARERLAQTQKFLEEELFQDSAEHSSRKKNRKIPDYSKYHDSQRRQLEERLAENITTSPQPFHLETERRHLGKKRPDSFPSTEMSYASSPYESRSSILSKPLRSTSAIGFPLNRNNLAAILRIQSARQRLEKEISKKQDELRRLDEARVKSRLMRRNPVWQSLRYSTAEDLMMRIEARREEERLRREEYEHFMELMFRRVRRIPTLFERQSEVSKSVQSNQHSKPRKKKVKPKLSDDESEESFKSSSKVSMENIYSTERQRSMSPTKMFGTKKSNSYKKEKATKREGKDNNIRHHVEFEEMNDHHDEEKGIRDETEKEENKGKLDEELSEVEEIIESVHSSSGSKSSIEEKEK